MFTYTDEGGGGGGREDNKLDVAVTEEKERVLLFVDVEDKKEVVAVDFSDEVTEETTTEPEPETTADTELEKAEVDCSANAVSDREAVSLADVDAGRCALREDDCTADELL